MKKYTYQFILMATAAVWLAGGAIPAHAVPTTWTFETSVPTTAGPITPEVGTGTGTASTGGTFSNPAGNGSDESWSSTAWDVGDYWQFQVDTTGYQDIDIAWDQTSNNTGPRDFKLQYSTDGSSFTDAGFAYIVLMNTWTSASHSAAFHYAVDLSAVTALDNDSSIYFRLTDTSTANTIGGTVAATGFDKVDNFAVNATSIPDPGSSAILLSIPLLGLLTLRRFTMRRAKQS